MPRLDAYGVAVGGEDGVVAQDVLHVLQADAGLYQVGCIAVAPMSPET